MIPPEPRCSTCGELAPRHTPPDQPYTCPTCVHRTTHPLVPPSPTPSRRALPTTVKVLMLAFILVVLAPLLIAFFAGATDEPPAVDPQTLAQARADAVAEVSRLIQQQMDQVVTAPAPLPPQPTLGLSRSDVHRTIENYCRNRRWTCQWEGDIANLQPWFSVVLNGDRSNLSTITLFMDVDRLEQPDAIWVQRLRENLAVLAAELAGMDRNGLSRWTMQCLGRVDELPLTVARAGVQVEFDAVADANEQLLIRLRITRVTWR